MSMLDLSRKHDRTGDTSTPLLDQSERTLYDQSSGGSLNSRLSGLDDDRVGAASTKHLPKSLSAASLNSASSDIAISMEEPLLKKEELNPGPDASPVSVQQPDKPAWKSTPSPFIYDGEASTVSESCTSTSNICRICHCGVGNSEHGASSVSLSHSKKNVTGSIEASGDPSAEEPLISPCHCSGTLKYVHQSCLQQWIKSAQRKQCELCNCDFSITSEIKPFRQWKKLNMTTVERRKVLCSVTFHVVAITCVIWSLYVLIDRTRQEVEENKLNWPFWTKLVVVAIGFTGGLVFMYVQCKMYVQLFRKWKDYNRVIYILEHEISTKGPNTVCLPSTDNSASENSAAPVVLEMTSITEAGGTAATGESGPENV